MENRFSEYGFFNCDVCGKFTREQGANDGTNLCPPCAREAMVENAHDDGHPNGPIPCHLCNPDPLVLLNIRHPNKRSAPIKRFH
jgi:hypothetical protein